MFMADTFNFLLFIFNVLLILVVLPEPCTATVYNVGDSAGWDISADLSDWPTTKIFQPGDILLFRYSSYHTLNEVDSNGYNSCNATKAISSYSDGNTSIPLTSSGDRYFICGALSHCLGGMKLHVMVEQVQAPLPSAGPQTAPVLNPGPNGTPANVEPTLPPFSSIFSHGESLGCDFIAWVKLMVVGIACTMVLVGVV